MKAHNTIKYLIITVLLLFMIVGFSASKPGKNQAFELNLRGGLPHFFEKAARSDSLTVAYLGGSITAQNGWRKYSFDWFKDRFPKVIFSEINAAIGGTGSDFGAFRLHEHVLKFNPDLVFIEFAVNDDNAPEERITRSMEGIVRQIWQTDANIDICFIYTIEESFIGSEQNGGLPTSKSTMEKIADHYKIPSINFGKEVCRLLKNGQLIFKNESGSKIQNGVKVFSRDGVHPYPETGHMVYHEVIKRSFEKIVRSTSPKIEEHNLPISLDISHFSNTQMIDFNEANLSNGWEILNIKDQPEFKKFGKYFNQVGKADRNETLTFRFKGKAFGIYDIKGPDTGRIIVEIDGCVKDTILRFDEACTYRRMNYFVIDNLENKEHEVVLREYSLPFDKRKILAKWGNVMKDPAGYKENNIYIAKILIDGVLLKP